MMLTCSKLVFLPVITTVWMTLMFIISYLVAVLRDDIEPLVPYISDTGAYPIESCIFGQMLNIGALLVFINIFVRFKVVEIQLKENEMHSTMFNKPSLYVGALSCFGLSLVANFQETNNIVIHTLGAAIGFGIGLLYFAIQTWLTYLSNVSKNLKLSRLLLTILLGTAYVSTTVASNISFKLFNNTNPLKWSSSDDGYDIHIVATVSEWLTAIFELLYILTFVFEFRDVELGGIYFKKKLNM